ncbi:hypothetical protein [Lachnospira pectinoschiza]|uniref:hypothetical protein n=1 Tax=Lachnospira pectinoschiza TaxID=28052 RepID=UPI0015D66F4F|nr:hypothetical protein [Lachnospira pectinoschiza]
MANFYGVSADYLLGLSENRNEYSSDIFALKHNDDAIGILKSGTINNRLICEGITAIAKDIKESHRRHT